MLPSPGAGLYRPRRTELLWGWQRDSQLVPVRDRPESEPAGVSLFPLEFPVNMGLVNLERAMAEPQ